LKIYGNGGEAGLPKFITQEGTFMTARVGKPAPEFSTKAYLQGEIKDVSLLDYRDKWVMLYFYPGDFTFV
jgi:hypothetical protein